VSRKRRAALTLAPPDANEWPIGVKKPHRLFGLRGAASRSTKLLIEAVFDANAASVHAHEPRWVRPCRQRRGVDGAVRQGD
jgi:hypothetical protein